MLSSFCPSLSPSERKNKKRRLPSPPFLKGIMKFSNRMSTRTFQIHRAATVVVLLILSLYGCGCCSAFSISSREYPRTRLLESPQSAALLLVQQQRRKLEAAVERCGNCCLWMSNELTDSADDGGAVMVWMPQLRRIMGTIASLGALETGYLTYTKLFTDDHLPAFCGVNDPNGSACQSVLAGPYSTLPFTNIPLASLGFVAYLLAVYLSLSPLLRQPSTGSVENKSSIYTAVDDDSQNRILLTALTTAMGTFSIFLMAVLFGVLHTSCPYCIFSAACSITLAQLTWIGGCLPETSSQSAEDMSLMTAVAVSKSTAVASSFAVATVGALLLFLGASPPPDIINGSGNNSLLASTSTTTILSSNQAVTLFSPPAITTHSSQRALKIAKNLQSLNAKMYGAYWCSHCHDQKQILGTEAFETYVDYVECSKDGMNSQSKLCRTKEVSGYPTWEIQGKLYPGQQELEELEDLVQDLLKSPP